MTEVLNPPTENVEKPETVEVAVEEKEIVMPPKPLTPATLAKLNEIQACLKAEKNVGVHV
jgi:hypothetical protein